MSQPVSARSKNKLVVGLRDNFSEGAKERSLSPALGLRPKEAIELTDMTDDSRNQSSNGFDASEYTSFSGTPDDESNGNFPQSRPMFSSNNTTPLSETRKKPGPRSQKRRLDTGYEDEGIEMHSNIGSDFSDTSRAASSTRSSSVYTSDDDLEYFCVDHMQLCSDKVIGFFGSNKFHIRESFLARLFSEKTRGIDIALGSLLLSCCRAKSMIFCNISIITEDIYLKHGEFVQYPKSNPFYQGRQFNMQFFSELCPFST